MTTRLPAATAAGADAAAVRSRDQAAPLAADPGWLPGRPATLRARVLLVGVNLAAIAFFLMLFPRSRDGFAPYRLDLDVYRIGGRVWLHGGNLYGALPPTASGVRLPFSYPPAAAILLSPLSLVPMAIASTLLTLATIALAALVLRVFLRSLGAGTGWWWTAGWLLPAALFLEPVRSTLGYGQVNVVLMALVALDCLAERTRWPRGALVGIAAAVKLTPAAFVLFFLLRRDYRAAAAAAGAFAVSTGAGFLLAPGDSARYWTSVVIQTGRPGSPAYAANQSIQGVLARAGLDPHSPAGAMLWLALSAVVLVLACRGMRRALASAADAWALSLNAFGALLVSPVSWSHHWVWGETAVLTLALLGRRDSRRAAAGARAARAAWAAAAGGLAVFAAAPQWWFPSGDGRELSWAPWQQVLGSSYVILAAALLLLAACLRSFPARLLVPLCGAGSWRQLLSGHTRYIVGASFTPTTRDTGFGGTSFQATLGFQTTLGFRRTLWLRNTRCGSATPSGKPRRPSYASTSPAGGSTRTSSTSGSPRRSPPRPAAT